MKFKHRRERLARRIRSWEEMVRKLSPQEALAFKKPGSLNK